MPVVISYRRQGNLHCLIVRPLRGFVHFSPPHDIAAIRRDWGEYHITVALEHLLQAARPQSGAVAALSFIQGYFAMPTPVVFDIDEVDTNNIARVNTTDPTTAPVLSELRYLRANWGRHRCEQLTISM